SDDGLLGVRRRPAALVPDVGAVDLFLLGEGPIGEIDEALEDLVAQGEVHVMTGDVDQPIGGEALTNLLGRAEPSGLVGRPEVREIYRRNAQLVVTVHRPVPFDSGG